jgi:hypothetical protein
MGDALSEMSSVRMSVRCDLEDCRFENTGPVAGERCVYVTARPLDGRRAMWLSPEVCSGRLEPRATSVRSVRMQRLASRCPLGLLSCEVDLAWMPVFPQQATFAEECSGRAWRSSASTVVEALPAGQSYEVLGSNDGWRLVRAAQPVWVDCAQSR